MKTLFFLALLKLIVLLFILTTDYSLFSYYSNNVMTFFKSYYNKILRT
jgi:hypothetical protein